MSSASAEAMEEREHFRARLTELASELDDDQLDKLLEDHGSGLLRKGVPGMFVFDIETEAGDEATIRELAPPYVKPAHPGDFDPDSVAYGQMKDPDKRAAKLADCQAKHAAEVRDYEAKCRQGEQDHWRKVFDDAALKPHLGRVVVIGVKNSRDGSETFLAEEREADTLRKFWTSVSFYMASGRRFLGTNIFNFDLPFLIRRSWINNVEVPEGVREGRYWNRMFVDVRDVWLCGQRYTDCESSLDHMARALGVGRKMDATIAQNFGKLWRSSHPDDHERAKKYLQRDLDLTLEIARRLQVIPASKVSA